MKLTNFFAKMRKVTCLIALLGSMTAHGAEHLGSLKMGIEPWLGYGLWYVAAHDGLFKKQGFKNVDIINFTEDKDINAALASGQIDVANIATHTAMGMIAAGLPVKAVLLLDQSNTADAILASAKIKSLKDIKGKKVAYEQGTTSDILLHSALSSVHLSEADIIPVPMPAANAGSALIAGNVPVAVTYEPYISVAEKNDPNLKMLYSGASDPGLISDVLVVRQSVINKHPKQVAALIEVWKKALANYRQHTQLDRNIIATAIGATPDDLKTAFDGIKYIDIKTNKQMLEGAFRTQTFPHILKAAKSASLVPTNVKFTQVFDDSFVKKAK
ncbi:ABC transporter substrate-binding protein [Celerinatantimonas diazotrophica]|uniref:NitT/TauT family transport system substrate-binding protein n=1 Tax=Celerinatantimonas diazotrophica TaxID=412034 RepID=A0A4R1K1F7_9GAMM|nr:ABC transporter substrate-binding protein [Celerinatantimonas diazotrophica]TCK57805.1 NitT/TauT family transport system substrate-binding protein [Celerinatantimonas diazotrophica]CAG9298131.1 Putative aliphatic sulfonates-binding protein [Celerinatantimonas diazotrophica]